MRSSRRSRNRLGRARSLVGEGCRALMSPHIAFVESSAHDGYAACGRVLSCLDSVMLRTRILASAVDVAHPANITSKTITGRALRYGRDLRRRAAEYMRRSWIDGVTPAVDVSPVVDLYTHRSFSKAASSPATCRPFWIHSVGIARRARAAAILLHNEIRAGTGPPLDSIAVSIRPSSSSLSAMRRLARRGRSG